MSRQILISIEREYGSGGQIIGEAIAKEFGFKYYERNLLAEMFSDNPELLQRMAPYEQKSDPIITRHVRGHSSATTEILAQMEFDFIKERAESGESFVLIGRCGNTLLRDYPGLLKVFVMGDIYDKIIRVCEHENLTEREAAAKIAKIDKLRKKFHSKYSDFKWGDSRAYDLCVNATTLGLEETTANMIDYIRRWIDKLERE
ncbi:MAG: cytidylate kinase-like family protein [Lachnospiraceae bacterium]|nr:cytidylate kinase-like family protein [Lachnospiraceae bacterium]